MGFLQLCVSDCNSDADCPGTSCETIEAYGMVLGDVCDCADDGDCGAGLTCCPIPTMDQNTCLTSCVNF